MGMKREKLFHEHSIKLHSFRLSNRARVMQVSSIRFAFEGDWNSIRKRKKLCRSETSLHLFKCLLNIIEGVRFVSDVNAHASPKKLFLYQMWFPLSNCDDKGETLGKWWLLGDRVRDLDWRAFALSTNSKITKRIKVFLFFHKHSKWKVIIYMMMKMNSKKKKINWKTSEYCDL